jgi:hypothetical protein
MYNIRENKFICDLQFARKCPQKYDSSPRKFEPAIIIWGKCYIGNLKWPIAFSIIVCYFMLTVFHILLFHAHRNDYFMHRQFTKLLFHVFKNTVY